MKILLSIKPEYANKIFAGTKIFEFRKSIHRDLNVDKVVVYATKPIGMIIGEFSISEIIQGEPASIWQQTKAGAGISKDFFDSYFSGRGTAYALRIGHTHRFDVPIEPRDLIDDFTPPQSFMYVNDAMSRVSVPQLSLELCRLAIQSS